MNSAELPTDFHKNMRHTSKQVSVTSVLKLSACKSINLLSMNNADMLVLVRYCNSQFYETCMLQSVQ